MDWDFSLKKSSPALAVREAFLFGISGTQMDMNNSKKVLVAPAWFQRLPNSASQAGVYIKGPFRFRR